MFMDPSAFEAEDLERELRDAGIESETAVAGTTNGGREDPLQIPGKSSAAAPPSSGSHFGLHSSGAPEGNARTSAGGDAGGERGPDHQQYHKHQPRALAENLGGSIRRHKATPSYGRHSKGGGSWPTAAQGRSQVSPPPSTPPSDNSGGGSYAFGHGDDGGGNRAGDEGKFREGSPDSYATVGSPVSSSSATGARSRARVLAQQREIQRKRRQQALNSGGIRPSDAASLSRGLVSSDPARALPRRPSEGAGGDGGGSGAEGHQEDGLLDGGRDGDGDEGEGSHTSFSPSVKQFSAPRQVEGDAYTAFNSNKRTSALGLSEFERRRSIGQVGLSDSDEDGEEGEGNPASANGGGGGRRRRNKNKAAPDMGSSTSPKGGSPTEEADISGQHAKTGHSRAENGGGSRRSNRPDDWDDRNRPSTKTYEWSRGSGDEGSDEAGASNGKGSAAWRSVGRKGSGSKSPVPTHIKNKNKIVDDEDDDASDARSADGPEEDSSADDSGSSRSYISSGSSRSRSSSAASPPRRSRGGRRRSYAGGRSRGGRGGGRGDSVSSSRSSRSGSGRSSSASEGGAGGQRRRGSPPRRRRHDENGGRPGKPHPGGHPSRGKRGSGGRSPARQRSSSPSPRGGRGVAGRGVDGKEERRHGRRRAPGSPEGGQGGHRRGDSSGSDQLSDSGRRSKSKSGNAAAAEPTKSSKDGNKRTNNNDGEEGSGERSKGGGGGGGGGGGRQEEKNDDEGKKDDGQEESKSSGRKDGKGGAPPAGLGAGGKRGDEGDGVPTAPSAAVAGAGAGPGGELEFNMAAIDLSDMKRFLMSPCPRAAGVVQCYIRRNKTRANKLFPEYTLFMKEGDRFLMCSKKRPNNATSNYLVSMRAGDLDRNSTNFLGKLRANFVGTEFQVFDDGYSPREQTGAFGGGWGSGNHGSGNGNRPMREELGCVMYASNVLGSRGPRKMQVAIPAISETGVVSKWSELDGGSGGSKAIERVKNRDYDGSLYMVNKPPRWNDQVGAYVLNFYGRVTMASVKNFQLVSTEDFDRIILQFGRVARDEFTMDFQYPISPFQAFAITLSSFDSKIACD